MVAGISSGGCLISGQFADNTSKSSFMFVYDKKGIIACATGATGSTAIAVIRISGFDNVSIFRASFSQKFPLKPRYSYFTKILNDDAVLDECILIYFQGPHSFTGENTLELQVHGNQLNVQRIIRHFIEKYDLREAKAGEFSYRAMLNNKLSASQVEGLDILLNAQSEYGLTQGVELLGGEIHQAFLSLRDSFLKMKTAIELLIDFSEDVGEDNAKKLFIDGKEEFQKKVSQLAARSNISSSDLLQPKIVLIGKTNSGKSSLFNLLLNKNRAIVSVIRGTTRDYLTEIININGNNFSLIDTAGLRETKDEIEAEGIKRSLGLFREAFFKIFLINPFDFKPEEWPSEAVDLIIFTHSDLPGFEDKLSNFRWLTDRFSSVFMTVGPIEPAKSGPIEPLSFGPIGPTKNGPMGPEKIGPTGPDFVVNSVSYKFTQVTSSKPLLQKRHIDLINKINLQNAELVNNFEDIAILDQSARSLELSINELIGVIPNKSLLNSIFNNFCIGK